MVSGTILLPAVVRQQEVAKLNGFDVKVVNQWNNKLDYVDSYFQISSFNKRLDGKAQRCHEVVIRQPFIDVYIKSAAVSYFRLSKPLLLTVQMS